MSGSPTDRFRVTVAAAALDRLDRYGAAEKAAGRLAEATALLREIDYRLKHEADEWGEGREFLAGMNMRVRVGTVGPITFDVRGPMVTPSDLIAGLEAIDPAGGLADPGPDR